MNGILCIDCKVDLSTVSRYVGAGDGSGSKFRCGPCADSVEIIRLRDQIRTWGAILTRLAHGPDEIDRDVVCRLGQTMSRQ